MDITPYLAQGANVPQFLSPEALKRQMYSNELLKQEVQTGQEEAVSRNALRGIFSDPANLDPETGMPNRNALAKVFQASPEAGMKITGQMNEFARAREAQQAQRIHSALYQLQINERQADDLNRIAVGSQRMYDELIASGVPKDEAVRQVSEARSQQLDSASQSGMFSPGQIDRMRGPFDPLRNRAFIAATPAYKEYLTGQKQDSEPPKTRERIEGEAQVQEEWDPKTRTWKPIGKGPRFAKSVTAAPPAADNSSWENWTEEEKDKFAEQALKDRSLLVGLGRGAQGAKALLDINKRIVDLQIKNNLPGAADRRAQFQADSSSLKKITQQYDAITTFENTALANGKVLVDLAKKVDTTGVPVIERWVRAGRKDVAGDADVSEFNAQIQLFGNEAAKILTNPSLSGVLTNEARQEVAGFLPKNATAQQIERVVGRLEKDFKNRESSTVQQMNAIRKRMEDGYKTSSAAPAAAPAADGAPKKVASKAEYDALPSGTRYVAPDGSIRTKK